MKKGFTIICENCGAKSTFSNWGEYVDSKIVLVAYNNYDSHDYEIDCTECKNEVELNS